MKKISRRFSRRFIAFFAAFTVVLSGLSVIPAQAVETTTRATGAAQNLPEELGEVVFQIPGRGDRQLFIIGHSHRSARTGANGSLTVQAQADVFRIGEWLIEQENVQLLLPEGYFQRKPASRQDRNPGNGAAVVRASLDHQTLIEKLSDTSVFTNADMLLRSNYRIQLHQIEDEKIYQGVTGFLQLAAEMRDSHLAGMLDLELDYLQEVRSAAMLQNIPDAIEFEWQSGHIDNRQAMFTIGMAHLDEIIRFLRDGRVELTPPALTFDNHQDHRALLKLVEEGYGVTVILPRSLVDNQDALRMANLDSI